MRHLVCVPRTKSQSAVSRNACLSPPVTTAKVPIRGQYSKATPLLRTPTRRVVNSPHQASARTTAKVWEPNSLKNDVSDVPITIQYLSEDNRYRRLRSNRASPSSDQVQPVSRGETDVSTNVSQILHRMEYEDAKQTDAFLVQNRSAYSSYTSPVKTHPYDYQSPPLRLQTPPERPFDAVQLALKSLILSAKGLLSTLKPVIRHTKEASIHLKYTKLASAVDFSSQILEAVEESLLPESGVYEELKSERKRSEDLVLKLKNTEFRMQENMEKDRKVIMMLINATNAQLESRLNEVSYTLRHMDKRLTAANAAVTRIITRFKVYKSQISRVFALTKELNRMKTFEMLYYKTQKNVLGLQREIIGLKQKESRKMLEKQLTDIKNETNSLGELLNHRQISINNPIIDTENHLKMQIEDLLSTLNRSESTRQELQVQIDDLLAENSALGSENSFLNKEVEEIKFEQAFLEISGDDPVKEMREILTEMQRRLQNAEIKEETMKVEMKKLQEKIEIYRENCEMAREDENRISEKNIQIQKLTEIVGKNHQFESQISDLKSTVFLYKERVQMAQEDEIRTYQRSEVVKNMRRRLEKYYDLMSENEHLKSRVTQQQFVHEHLHKRLQDYDSRLMVPSPVLPAESPGKSIMSDSDLRMQYEAMVKYQEILCLGYFQVTDKVAEIQNKFKDLRNFERIRELVSMEENRDIGVIATAIERGLEDIRSLWVQLRKKYEAAGGILAVKAANSEGKQSSDDGFLLGLLEESLSVPVSRHSSPDVSTRLNVLTSIELLFAPYLTESGQLVPLLRTLIKKLEEEDIPLMSTETAVAVTGDMVSRPCVFLDPAPIKIKRRQEQSRSK